MLKLIATRQKMTKPKHTAGAVITSAAARVASCKKRPTTADKQQPTKPRQHAFKGARKQGREHARLQASTEAREQGSK